MQASGVNQQPASQCHRVGAPNIDLDAAAGDPPGHYRTKKYRYGSGVLGVTLQR
jgi:hypothetical protein